MNQDSRIYLAGHQGLVGGAILRRLAAGGYGNVITRARQELDLIDQAAVRAFFEAERPEYVFLAAAKVGGILANKTYPAEFIYDNLMIQTNIIHESYRAHVNRLLFLGSSCIYPKHCPQPMKEEHLLTGELEPTNEPYAVAKIAGIKMCDSYNRQYGTQYLAVMPTNLYGPNDNFDLMNSHVLPALIRKFHLAKLAGEGDWGAIEADEHHFGLIPDDIKAALGLNSSLTTRHSSPKVVLWGTGSPHREFLQVDDLADACVFLMNRPYEEYSSLLTGHSSPLINIGTGVDQTIRELAELVADVVGYKGEVIWDEVKPDGTPRKLLDVTQVQDLGWRARVDLREGIREVYKWYLGQSDQKGREASIHPLPDTRGGKG